MGFKNEPGIDKFQVGMRFRSEGSPVGEVWQVVHTRPDGRAVCARLSDGVIVIRQEPDRKMILDLDYPWVGREYASRAAKVKVVMVGENRVVVATVGGERREWVMGLDVFGVFFKALPLEVGNPFQVGDAVQCESPDEGRVCGVDHDTVWVHWLDRGYGTYDYKDLHLVGRPENGRREL